MAEPVDCEMNNLVMQAQNMSIYKNPELLQRWRITNSVLYACVLLWLPFSTGIFLYYKARFPRTRIRPTFIVFISVAAILCYANTDLLPAIVGNPDMPCGIVAFLLALVCPLLGLCVISHQMYFVLMGRFSAGAYHFGRVSPEELAASNRLIPTTFCGKVNWRLQTSLSAYRMMFVAAPITKNTPRTELVETLTILRFLVAHNGFLVCVLVAFLPFLILAGIVLLTNEAYLGGCTGCPVGLVVTCICLGQAFLILIMGAILGMRSRGISDPYGMQPEIFMMLRALALATVCFGLTLLPQVADSYAAVFLPIGSSIAAISFHASQTVYQVYQGFLLEWKIRRETTPATGDQGKRANAAVVPTLTRRNSRQGMEETSGGSSAVGLNIGLSPSEQKLAPTLYAILTTSKMDALFEEHLGVEQGSESLYFLQDTAEWRMTFHDVAESARASRANRIAKTYVDSSGIYSINIPHTMAIQITKNLNKSNEEVPYTLFDAARGEIARMLEMDVVQRFIDTPAYHALVSDLAVRDVLN